ncbi:hypothetical protein B0H17DRAFT_1142775 [Mycena rosella]|uniref:Uncharacterized protein n=1 Tax=Mycena rosella TaxID=1033263 RepID=A0AAD7G8Q1_MYCRO|nr:hypothetical protein B0H17DRAFT_1142775 [Mycena rosella]
MANNTPVPRTPTGPICRFDSWLTEQLSFTKDLAIFSPTLDELVRAAWVEYTALAAEIIMGSPDSPDEHVYVYCHHNPPRCTYFMDLLRVSQESSLEAQYPPVIIHHAPYTQGANGPWHPSQPRVFGGYLGEIKPLVDLDAPYLADPYKRTTMRIMLVDDFELVEGQLGPKHEVHRQEPEGQVAFVSYEEAEAIKKLGQGIGLSRAERASVFKVCPVCQKFFWTRLAFNHTQACGRADGKARRSERSKK